VRGFPTAVGFLTRVRVARSARGPGDVGRSVPWFPVVGALLGVALAAAYVGARAVLPPVVAAVAAVGIGLGLTGALHEDGLADTMDALGGWNRTEALRILKDPAHGTFGVSAIVLSIVIRAAALASLDPWAALGTLPAAHALSRGAAMVLLRVGPSATEEGLGASFAASVTTRGAAVAGAVGLILASVGMGVWAVPAMILTSASVGLVGWIAVRRIGGVTGDVLGAAQQSAEVVILLVGAAAGPALAWWR